MINNKPLLTVWSSSDQGSLSDARKDSAAALIKKQLVKRERPFANASMLMAIALLFLLSSFPSLSHGAEMHFEDLNLMATPEVGSHGLRILSPNYLELTLITTKEREGRVAQWDFVGDDFIPNLPNAGEFLVTVGGNPVEVQAVGFKRVPIYAPLKQRDLRIGNYLYLQIAASVPDSAQVEVKNPNGRLWQSTTTFSAVANPHRFNPAIHVNQVGYVPSFSKKAMVGLYLGSVGELPVTARTFSVVRADTGSVVFQGQLTQRLDKGFASSPAPYQQVWEADFTALTTPGEYRLVVPGLGASTPFLIHEGAAATFARTFALGLYHQRCGCKNEFPFTRHTHDACHVAPAEIPTMAHSKVNEFLNLVSGENMHDARHTAPRLQDVNSSLYPFLNQGKIDVSGGHHDAGDYSKYTINSAGLIHHLLFAADSFAGVGELDNLGLPESGDGKSDILQEAKWEADFLAKMQDADGGFYFLVYPRDRRYEDDVLPDKGDPQVVWPKTTAVTAAATAALAEMGSSPLFRQQFPAEADLYLEKARKGWEFLESAIALHGKDGSYQVLTHYGNEFLHDDELAWAAAAMFVATGDSTYHEKLKSWFDPGTKSTWRWDWWRLYEGYGCAARTYAFAARSGRLQAHQLDGNYQAKCEAEIKAAANDQARFAKDSSYGTSFPDLNKQNMQAGWFFSSERAFDIAVGYQLSPKNEYLDAILSNLGYEAGCNPINVAYVTGLGWKRQRDVVHQYAQVDHRVLPPTGLPLGNVQAGFGFHYHYQTELTALAFPPYFTGVQFPLYDRWADTFNTTTEFVVVDQARSLANAAFVMALTSVKNQPWKSAVGQIVGLPASSPAEQSVTATLDVPGVDLTHARIVWEARDQQPAEGGLFTFAPMLPGPQWVEVEAQLPDGRRIFAATQFNATFSLNTPPNNYQKSEVGVNSETVALYHLNGNTADATGRNGQIVLSGGASLDESNVGWMENRSGASLAFQDLGDKATVGIPTSLLVNAKTTGVQLEAMIYINEYKAYNRSAVRLLSLGESWNASIELAEDPYAGPQIRGGTGFSSPATAWKHALTAKQWHHLSLTIDQTGYTVRVNGAVVANQASSEFSNWGRSGTATLEIGNFNGWVDEVIIRSLGGAPSGGTPQVSSVEPPKILPGSGHFVEPVAVEIKPVTPGSSVRYTVDGSIPNENSPLYEKPFTVAANATVKARAFKPGLTESPVTSADLVIDPTAPAGQAQAQFIKADEATDGTWKQVYGAEGFGIPGDRVAYPSAAQVRHVGNDVFKWADVTSDSRALQSGNQNSRLASCWYAGGTFLTGINLTDGKSHQLALYFLDWDRMGRVQTVEILDAATGAVLDTQTVANFQEGRYLVWNIKGNISVRISKVAGPNALLTGLFMDAGTGNSGNNSGTAAIQSVQRLAGGQFKLRIAGQAGANYQVEASGDLKTWTQIGAVTLLDAQQDFTDTEASSVALRFYRIVPVQ